ncbi:hypothetical protein GCM10010277_83380 [Streptomyces longisporoflavus]|nr:hypothetical protein GCM10010277_83380 [Streptomyces longisporoflavus]
MPDLLRCWTGICTTCQRSLHSFRYAARQDWGKIARLLKPVYTAATEEAALDRFAEFVDAWGRKYPAIVELWENARKEFTPFLRFDTEIRRIVCTTNAIESVNARIRRAVKAPQPLAQRASRPEVPLHGNHVPRPHRKGTGPLGHDVMDVNALVRTAFSGPSRLIVEDVTDGPEAVVVTARTRDEAVPCPASGTLTAKVHGYHGRTVSDVPVDGRQVVVHLRVRRLVCPVLGCRQQTSREQIPGLLEPHQRRTVRLARQMSQVARELCGRAAARLAALPAVPFSRSTALRHPRRLRGRRRRFHP